MILSFSLHNFVDAFSIRREMQLLCACIFIAALIELSIGVCFVFYGESKILFILLALVDTYFAFSFLMIQNYWVLRQIIKVYQGNKKSAVRKSRLSMGVSGTEKAEEPNSTSFVIELNLIKHIRVQNVVYVLFVIIALFVLVI